MTMKSIKDYRGLTLIELMITVAIVAILLGVALPSFNQYITKSKITQQTWAFRDALSFARQMAIKQGDVVTVCMVDGTNACIKENGSRVAIFRDTNKNRVFDSDELIYRLQKVDALKIKLSASGRDYVRFKANGGSKESGNFQICSKNSKYAYARRAIVFRSGRVRLSSDSDNDGFDDTEGQKISCS